MSDEALKDRNRDRPGATGSHEQPATNTPGWVGRAETI